jgi:NADH:ubiquinone oxidoreductase subunit 3 (subunit A)
VVDLGVFKDMGSNAFTLLMVVVIAVIVGAIVTAVMLAILNFRKYQQFKLMIFEKDGAGNTIPKFDNAGVFVDRKTGNKRLFLQNANVGLSPDNIPFLPIGKERWILLLRTGLKNYRYIRIDFNEDLIKFDVGEEDVNWATNVYESQKKRFATGWLAQYLPFIIIGFTSIIMLIMFIWLFNKIGTIQEIANTMLLVADKLAQAGTGTTIIPK